MSVGVFGRSWSTETGRPVLTRLINIGSHLASVLLTMAGLIIVTFLVGRTMPIDPVVAIVGTKAPPSVVAKARFELGLDQPLISQFWIYTRKLAHGDLGVSLVTGQPVKSDILQYFPATIELATTAMILAMLVGIPLGVFAAANRSSRFDVGVRIFGTLGQSMPIFVAALLGLLIFYAKLDIAPGTGQQDIIFQGMVPRLTGMLVIDALLDGQTDAFWDAVAHLMMPSLLLSLVSLSAVTLMTRTFMLEVLSEEYITAARAKGLSPLRILWRHAFLNIAGRLVTVLALTYAGLLEGAVLVETVFSWPGLGLYLTRSLLNADMNAVLGATLVIGVIYVILNLAADVVQRVLDPRAN